MAPSGKRMLAKLPDHGLIGLAYWDHGFRIVTNSRRPITKVEDFAGLEDMRTREHISIETFNALGPNAVSMLIPELYTALETKAVDGQENPYAAVEALKLDEVSRTPPRHAMPTIRWSCSPSKKTWDGCRRRSAR